MRAHLDDPCIVADNEADRLLAIARQQRHMRVKTVVAGGPLDPLLGAPAREARSLAKGVLVGCEELPGQRGRPLIQRYAGWKWRVRQCYIEITPHHVFRELLGEAE